MFLPRRKLIVKIQYESNIMAEVPRAFKCTYYDEELQRDVTLGNLAPKYNPSRGCYTLNFYGRAKKASARNFQLIDEDGSEDNVILMHGKLN